MAKTALDLTDEEIRLYKLNAKFTKCQIEDRWEQAWVLARMAAKLLRERFEAKRVVVFGSLAHRDRFNPWSDVDIAAWGIPADQFYRAVAAVTGISYDFHVDLVDPEDCRISVCQTIEHDGIEI